MAKVEITEKYQPGEEEAYIRLLKAAHIEERPISSRWLYCVNSWGLITESEPRRILIADEGIGQI